MAGTSERDREHVPSWAGNPETWQAYKDEVRIWLLGSKLDVEYSLAARLVAKLRGPARRIGLSMTDAELNPPRAGENPDLRAGVNNLMTRLERLVPHAQDRRGNYMKQFFKEERYKRRPGERIPDWISRWVEGVTLLQRDGINFDQI